MKYTIFNFIESVKYTFFLLIVLAVVFLPFSVSAGTGTIQGSTKFAWSNQLGYINFAPVVGGTYYGLTITDSTVTGYAWSANSGWIKFNDFTNSNVGSEAGVKNNGGVLSGYAWGSNLGWINFNGVTINTSTGKFSGTAGGSGILMGTLKFDDCPTSANCNVVTDWRPTIVNTSPANTGGILLPLPIIQPLPAPTVPAEPVVVPETPVVEKKPETKLPDPFEVVSKLNENPLTPPPISEFPPTAFENVQHIETHNEDLTLSLGQAGTYNKDVGQGGVIIINIPNNSLSSTATVSVDLQSPELFDSLPTLSNISLINKSFYNINIKDVSTGQAIHSFSQPLTITLPIPKELTETTNLAVYWLDEVKNEWVIVPDAIFSDGQVIFKVNHLTRFAIFQAPEGEKVSSILSAKAQSTEIAKKKFPLKAPLIILSIIAVLGISLILWKRK